MIRLHVTPDLTPSAAVAPTLDQSRYLTQVMRLKLGDALLVFNGRDGEWRCVIADILKKGVILRVEDQVRPQAFGPDLDLVVAVVKKSRVETIVEKAAELGAKRVRLTVTQRTNVEHVRLDRLDAIAIEAAEQTGRLDVPAIEDPQKLATLLDDWDADRRLMFCDETGGAPVIAALSSPSPSGARADRIRSAPHRREAPGGGGKARPHDGSPSRPHPASAAPQPPSPEGEGDTNAKWAILIGPEGGFAPEERDRLRALPFTTAVSLGPRILRADTAAIAAMTLWQAAVGDWER